MKIKRPLIAVAHNANQMALASLSVLLLLGPFCVGTIYLGNYRIGIPGNSVPIKFVTESGKEQTIDGHFRCGGPELQPKEQLTFWPEGASTGWTFTCIEKEWGQQVSTKYRYIESNFDLSGVITIPTNAPLGVTPGRLKGRIVVPRMARPGYFQNSILSISKPIELTVVSPTEFRTTWWYERRWPVLLLVTPVVFALVIAAIGWLARRLLRFFEGKADMGT